MLFGEIAIHPDCLEPTIDRLVDLDSKFGFNRGALISNLPRRMWAEFKQKVVTELIEAGGLESKVAEDILERLEHAFVKFGRTDLNSQNWLVDINNLHAQVSFHTIVSKCGGENTCHYIQLNEKLQNLGDDKITPKEAAKFIGEAFPLIKVSKTISFIDPYISIVKENDIWKSTYIHFFRCLFAKLAENGARKVVEIHKEDRTKQKNGELTSVEQQKMLFTEFLTEICPENVEVKVFWWDDKGTSAFHARHIISEIGAIKFDSGFPQPHDLDKRRQPVDMSVVQAPDSIKALLAQFDPFDSEMHLVANITINTLR
jgi:hypothetical protein